MLQVSGPEDPKLLAHADGRWGLAFSSLPPRSLGGETCDNDDAVTQMYVTSSATPLALDEATGTYGAVGVRLACGATQEAEKNWIGFTWQVGLCPYVLEAETRSCSPLCWGCTFSIP